MDHDLGEQRNHSSLKLKECQVRTNKKCFPNTIYILKKRLTEIGQHTHKNNLLLS